MVLFSELCALGPRHEAETLPGPTEARLCALARETGLWLIPGPLFERVSTPEGDRVYFFDISGSGDGGVGQSIVIDPSGYVLHQSHQGPAIIPIEVDLLSLRRQRERSLRGNLGQPLKRLSRPRRRLQRLPPRQRCGPIPAHAGAAAQARVSAGPRPA